MEREEILHEALVAPRAVLLPRPDTRVVDRPGWFQIITPSFARGGLNEVSGAILDEVDADAVIDRTLADYRARGIRFRWTITPGSRPFDLAERLAARGMTRSWSQVMFRSTAGLAAADAAVPVEEIDARTLPEFTRTMALGWEMDPAVYEQFHRDQLSSGLIPMYLARLDGEPAAVAASVILPRSAYLIGAVTLPAFRGRGAYRALIEARLRYAAALGLPLVTTVAREDTSAPILRRLGFETACRMEVLTDG